MAPISICAVDVGDLSSIKYMNDQFGNGDVVLRADNGGVMHRQPAIIKGINPTAVACAVPHLDEDFAATVDHPAQVTQQWFEGFLMPILGLPAALYGGRWSRYTIG